MICENEILICKILSYKSVVCLLAVFKTYYVEKQGLFLSTLSDVRVTCALNLPKVFFTPVSSEEKKEIENDTWMYYVAKNGTKLVSFIGW